jgi:hypothetical protein
VVVPLVVPLRVGGTGTARRRGDAGHRPGGQHHRAGPVVQLVHHLLDRHQRAARRQHGLLLDPDDAPELHVAGAVGTLRVHDPDVEVEGLDRGEGLAGEGAGDRLDGGGVRWQVGADVAAQHGEGQARRGRDVAVGHPGVAVLFDLQRPWPAVLDRVPEPVQRADAGIAAPGKDQLAGAARADHLVVDDVGGQPDQGEVAPALADDLVAGGDRDEVGESLERDRVAVVDEFGDGFPQGYDLRHSHPPARCRDVTDGTCPGSRRPTRSSGHRNYGAITRPRSAGRGSPAWAVSRAWIAARPSGGSGLDRRSASSTCNAISSWVAASTPRERFSM